MNLILVDADEVDAAGIVALTDRRARHLVEVVGANPGRVVRVGLVDGPLGTGEVRAVRGDRVELRCAFDPAPPPRGDDLLVLALPRPAVLGRCLETAAALGFARITVVRTWRSDKAHLASNALRAEQVEHRLRLGLEQAARTAMPTVRVAARFRPFVEDDLPGLAASAARRVVAHPDGAPELATLTPRTGAVALAVGPERGFTAFEVERFVAAGFVTARAGPHPLRVETALVAMHARLALLRELAAAT